MAEAGAGLVVPPGDAEALARAIRGWLDGTAEREEAGRRAVAWAGTFAVERVAEEMEQFHRAVLAAGRRAP
jgi:glycosyltransferase involved in cell wall biosynthesis